MFAPRRVYCFRRCNQAPPTSKTMPVRNPNAIRSSGEIRLWSKEYLMAKAIQRKNASPAAQANPFTPRNCSQLMAGPVGRGNCGTAAGSIGGIRGGTGGGAEAGDGSADLGGEPSRCLCRICSRVGNVKAGFDSGAGLAGVIGGAAGMPMTPGAISSGGDSGTISDPIVGMGDSGAGGGAAGFTSGSVTGFGAGSTGLADSRSRFNRMISVSNSLRRLESSSTRSLAWTARTINQMARPMGTPRTTRMMTGIIAIKFPFCRRRLG